MARRSMEPPAVQDGLSPGDTILSHTPEQAEAYRKITRAARHRQESQLPPESAQAAQPAAPGAPRVDVGLAEMARAKRVGQLQGALFRYESEVQQPAIGANGMVDQHRLERQRAVQGVCEGIRAELAELAALDGETLTRWAEVSGVIAFTQSGSAVLR